MPKLRMRSPDIDLPIALGQRNIEVAGEVETAASVVSLEVEVRGNDGCPGGPMVQTNLLNDTFGFREISFLLDQVSVDSFSQEVRVRASVGPGAERRRTIPLTSVCDNCQLGFEVPRVGVLLSQTILPSIAGQVDPNTQTALWRVRGGDGGLFDGLAELDLVNLRFEAARLPLFPGTNIVEVVTFAADGLETRCTTHVRAPGATAELLIVLTWDDPVADFDLHLVGPMPNSYGVVGQDLSPRASTRLFGGEVMDDSNGRGPETLTAAPPDGVYGVAVEPLSGKGSASIRVLERGRPLSSIPLGPRFIDGDRRELWLVARLVSASGGLSLETVDRVVEGLPPAELTDW